LGREARCPLNFFKKVPPGPKGPAHAQAKAGGKRKRAEIRAGELPLQESEKALVKSLVHVIWADGEVTDDERRLLGGVLTQLQLDDASIKEVAQMMAQPPSIEDLKNSIKDAETRKEIMKVLLAMSMADGKVEISELRFLNRIARQLDISDADLEQLKNETLQEIEGGLG
jgi:uncharacterized tellurite resistance protein B-like protein